MAEYEKKVRDILKRNNCHFLRRGKGDHDIWYSPITNRHITVDTKIKHLSPAAAHLAEGFVFLLLLKKAEKNNRAIFLHYKPIFSFSGTDYLLRKTNRIHLSKQCGCRSFRDPQYFNNI